MPVVAIIGVDEAGKSTLIQELKDKYPDKIDVLAFPTLPLREELATLSIDYTDIHSILNYHMRFQLDFSEQQELIRKYLHQSDKLLILDRYFYCSLAYLRYAVLKNYNVKYWKEVIRPLLATYYKYYIYHPDMVIWLQRDDLLFELNEDSEIQMCYTRELEDEDFWYNVKPLSALRKDTNARVERALIERGFLS